MALRRYFSSHKNFITNNLLEKMIKVKEFNSKNAIKNVKQKMFVDRQSSTILTLPSTITYR